MAKLDPRLLSVHYDFRFFGDGTPVDQARNALARAFRLHNRMRASGQTATDDIARANRMMWAARNQAAIMAAINGAPA